MTTVAPARSGQPDLATDRATKWQPVGSIFFAGNRSGNQTGNLAGNVRGSCSEHGRPR
jgi:hypothetical protein